MKKIIILIFVFYFVAQAETAPGLSSPKFSFGLSSQDIIQAELEFGASLPLSKTQSVFASFGVDGYDVKRN